MSRKEFKEVRGITLEMKASGQTEILNPTPIAMARPTIEVIVEQTSVQAHAVPYIVVV